MKIKRQITFLIIALFILLYNLSFSVAATSSYSDIEGHWAQDEIERWSDYKIITGYDDHFNPDASITRAELAKIIATMLCLEPNEENPFTDISGDEWYASYILACYKHGIILGYNGKAYPSSAITRQEAAVMICRALHIAPAELTTNNEFSDSSDIADWASGYITSLSDSGIINGVGENRFAPLVPINRASVITMLDRAIVQYINTPGTYELSKKSGTIIIATSGNAILTGSTDNNVIIAYASNSAAIDFSEALVNGEIFTESELTQYFDKTDSFSFSVNHNGKSFYICEKNGSAVLRADCYTVSPGASVSYEWYICTDSDGSNPVLIENATQKEYSTDPFINAEVRYYRCKITASFGNEIISDFTDVYCVGYTGLPSVRITTPNNAEIVSKDDWMKGATISVESSSADNMNFEPQSMSIRGRGNSTWLQEKKPYAIKLDSKRDILGMAKHKRWVLIANYLDNSFMKNEYAFYLSRTLNMDYTVGGQFVNLFLNGEYIGLYWLGEAIKVDENRVNINDIEPASADEDYDYLIELDIYFDEKWKFYSDKRNLPYMIQNDDYMTTERLDRLKAKIDNIESLLYPEGSDVPDENYVNYINIDSFAKFWLINELTGNYELMHPKSCYFTFNSNTGVLSAGPVWDFDWSFSNDFQQIVLETSNELLDTNAIYYDALFKSPAFVKAVKDIWASHRNKIAVVETIDSFKEYLLFAQSLDEDLWGTHPDANNISYNNFDDYVTVYKNNLLKRMIQVDEFINNL